VRALVDGIAAAINRDPVNASVATFDPNTKAFTFHSDENGIFIDADAIYEAVVTRLDNGYYYDNLYVEPAVLLADTTKAELMNSFGLISKFTTDTTSSANRNTNIRLSAEAITNRTILPGETFSFNQATGQRTEAKGYKPAAAIAGGETFDEIGGGVCQTSTTLFNAVVRANLKIVERDPHAWPSTYVPKGEDATVNWPNLDFRFRNDTDQPIQLHAWCEGDFLHTELRTTREFPFSYRIVEEDHHFHQEENGKYYRKSRIYRETIDKATGEVIKRELKWKNRSEVMFYYDLIPADQISK
jgi:vancomycin resistance protein YoaR